MVDFADDDDGRTFKNTIDKDKFKARSPTTVHEDAEKRVLAANVDQNETVVLGQYTLEFGKYVGETFHWVMSHCPGYLPNIAASFKRGNPTEQGTSHLVMNKKKLKEYVRKFPESTRYYDHLVKQKSGATCKEAPAASNMSSTEHLAKKVMKTNKQLTF